MDCQGVRARLLDDQRRRLPPNVRAELRAHVLDCPACARIDAAERALTDLLDRGMPQYPASFALKRRLEAEWPASTGASLPSVLRVPQINNVPSRIAHGRSSVRLFHLS